MTGRPALNDIADRVARAGGLDVVLGRPSVLRSYRRVQRDIPDLPTAVAAVGARLEPDAPTPDDEPVFILSAGWRSGSTFLQRLVLSADRHFIWGEPYHQSDLIRRLAESLIPFGTGWPRPRALYAADGGHGDGEQLHDRWVANLYPPVSRVVEAHRACLRELLAPPSSRADLGWGMKEVRLSAEYGLYLRLLFPRAKLVFLVRDPRRAYSSYRERPQWYERWPRSQVRTPSAYGRMWRRLAASFVAYERDLGALLIRYEDLVDGGEAVDRLESLLGAPVDRSVLVRRISGATKPRSAGPSPLELRMLDRATRPTAAALGYDA